VTRSSPLHVIILAGGSGTRFWPLSRAKRPKQFLSFGGRRSLLRATWDRARSLAPASRIWVAAPRALAASVRRELPALGRARLILEPTPRDTAPAIALACAVVSEHDPAATVAVLPSDHVIADGAAFSRAVASACRAARDGALVCLGIAPDRAATGFGYLELAAAPKPGSVSPVVAFVEKPDAARARRFVRSGRYLWNGGMFVWRVDRFLAEVAKVAPDVHRAAVGAAAGSAGAWRRSPKISLDYAVMEKASRVVVVRLDAGWDDVGSWDAAARHAQADAGRRGGRLLLGSEGSVAFGDGRRLIAILDVPGVVVVDTKDALLVVARASSERTKELVRELASLGRKDLL
jgi:mannose-1-phosphate guanylyltransferase